jgi:carboxyl-terminal processing protease
MSITKFNFDSKPENIHLLQVNQNNEINPAEVGEKSTPIALEETGESSSFFSLAKNRKSLILEASCLILFVFCSVLLVDKFWPAEINRQTASTKQEILNIIENKYTGTLPSKEDQAKGELAGLVASLQDPYSQYIPKDKINEFQNGLNEKYSGIGVRFSRETGKVLVTQIFKDGPASNGGIQVGDELVKVDDKSVASMTNEQLANAIKGEENSTVNITVLRSGLESSFKITRKNVQSDMVSLEVRGEVGIINISTFGENSASKMMAVAAQVRSNQNIKKLVLDLRSNTGGLLDQSVLIASFFLPENSTFVKEVYKNDAKEEKTIAQSNSLLDYPIVVVTDGSTASASEILAAALRDDRQVKLIGQKTYGKGVVQQVFTLRNGDLLKVTIAEWITPKGDKINLKGLEPDILVDLNKNSVDRAVEEILK